MANWYVWSGATFATGTTWADAYTTIKAAAEAAGTAAGDSIWVAHDHAETTAALMSITPKNTKAAPGTICCVNRAGSVPPVPADFASTATVTDTGGNMSMGGQTDGPTLWQGIIFINSSGNIQLSNSSALVNNFKNCSFRKTSASQIIGSIQATSGKVIMDNCTAQFGNIGDTLSIGGSRTEWINTPNAIIGSVFPTTLFGQGAGAEVTLRGVDFSAITGTLMQAPVTGTAHDVKLINCKLAAGVNVVSPLSISPGGGRVSLINCDSGATNYRSEKYMFGGNQFTETIIVRTGGASDGTTPISWRIVTDANSRWQIPFESLPIATWNDSPGAHTVSVYAYWNNAAVPNNDDIWIEIEALTTAGFPISSIVGSGKASFLVTNAPIPGDSSTWGGGAGNSKFKMSVPITTAMKGPINVVCKAAKASSTFYIDPKIEIL